MKKALYAVLAVLVIIQFIPVLPENKQIPDTFAAPSEVKAILKRSCYDCHSQQTLYPWYSRIAPLSWLIAHDVKEGREELSLDNWENLRKHSYLAEEIVEEIEEGEMPLLPYLWAHPDAAVTADELEILKSWRNSLQAE